MGVDTVIETAYDSEQTKTPAGVPCPAASTSGRLQRDVASGLALSGRSQAEAEVEY